MSSTVSNKITYLNFTMTMGIVIYHWKNFYDLARVGESRFAVLFELFSDVLGATAMGVFFALSGFLFYHGAKDIVQVSRKMKTRLYSLGIPLLVWNTLVLMWKLFYSHFILKQDIHLSGKDFILGYTLQMFDGPLWYLLALLMLIVLSPIVIKCKKYKYGPEVCLALSIMISLIAGHVFTQLYYLEFSYWFERFFRYWIAYFGGAYAALKFDETISYEKYNAKSIQYLCIALAALLAMVVVAETYNGKGNLTWIIYRIIPFILWFSVRSSYFQKTVKYPFRISFFIYAMHLSILIPTINDFVIPHIANKSCHYLIVFLIHISLICLLYLIVLLFVFVMEKILPEKYFHALSGGRI